LLLILILTGCQSSTLEEFKAEGQNKVHALSEEFRKIKTRDELLDAEERLKACYRDIAASMFAASDWKDQHPGEEFPILTETDRKLSENVRLELIRLYRIEGGKEILEKCQRQAFDH